MPTLPDSREARITFFEVHLPVWEADPAAIGLDASLVAQLAQETADARAALEGARAARQASKAATQYLYDRSDRMSRTGGAAIDTIRAFAKASGDPEVYTLAQIPAPAAPTPAPAPEAPTDITISLYTTGELRLMWKVTQPARGAEVYTTIARQLDGAGPFIEIASTGEKVYIDAAVPAGTRSVSYVLRARRGAQASRPSAVVTQHLGKAAATPHDASSLTLAA